MKKINILSGKGGVGKSSITASIAVVLSKSYKIICADCDVDASNLALVLGVEEFDDLQNLSTNQKANFDYGKCTGCKKCVESCYFDAINFVDNKPLLKQFSCEGCGVCEMVCPTKAIDLVNIDNAKIGHADTNYGFKVVSAQLEMGESGSGKVVSEVKKLAMTKANNADFMIVDSAAGIGCPVIASVAGSDYCVLVTEPTPSGFSDMKRALEVVNHFKIPYGIVINKHDINLEYTKNIETFAKEQNVSILAKIPYDKIFVEALVNLVPVVAHDNKIESIFEDLCGKLMGVLD